MIAAFVALGVGLCAAGSDPVRLTLDDAVSRARAHAPRLAAAAARSAHAAAQIEGAAAERKPSFELSGGYTRASDVPELALRQPDGTSRTIFPNLPDNWRARVAASLPLYTSGRIASAVKAAELDLAAAQAERGRSESDLVFETSSAYWSLVLARASERALGLARVSFAAHRKAALDRAEVGMAARSETLAVEVEELRAEWQSLEAASTASIAEASLARLAGFEPGTALEPIEPLTPPPAARESLEDLVREALDRRGELASLRARAAAAEARSAGVRAGSKPQARLAAGYDYANPNRRILPPEAEFRGTWDVGVDVALSLFDGGRRDAALAASQALVSAARYELEDASERIRFEVTAVVAELATARSALDVAARGLAAATEAERVAGDRYREGVAASADLLDAGTRRLRAELDATAAAVRAAIAGATLTRALGR